MNRRVIARNEAISTHASQRTGMLSGTKSRPRQFARSLILPTVTYLPDLYSIEIASFLAMTRWSYFAIKTTVAPCNPADVAVKVIFPAFSFDCMIASARPLNALR
jgi:hypothetical protein